MGAGACWLIIYVDTKLIQRRCDELVLIYLVYLDNAACFVTTCRKLWWCHEFEFVLVMYELVSSQRKWWTRIIFIFQISWTNSSSSLCSRLMKLTCCNLWMYKREGLTMMRELSSMVWIRLVPWCLSDQTGHQIFCQNRLDTTSLSVFVSKIST